MLTMVDVCGKILVSLCLSRPVDVYEKLSLAIFRLVGTRWLYSRRLMGDVTSELYAPPRVEIGPRDS